MNKLNLPGKLSELLRLAVNDAKKVESMEDYVLDMNQWHSLKDDNRCHVCMAGAIIACSGQFSNNNTIYLDSFYNLDADSLYQLDDMRTGSLPLGYPEEIGLKFSKIINQSFDEDLDRADWDTYLKAADYLEENEL